MSFVDPNVFETANAGFAQAMYEEYLRDPAAVGPEWRRLFESGVVGERPENGRAGGRTGRGFRSTVGTRATPIRTDPVGASPGPFRLPELGRSDEPAAGFLLAS